MTYIERLLKEGRHSVEAYLSRTWNGEPEIPHIEELLAAFTKTMNAIDATPAGTVPYEPATALWHLFDAVANRIETEIVCSAPDYPIDEEIDDDN